MLELARAEQRGVQSVPGVSAQIYQVQLGEQLSWLSAAALILPPYQSVLQVPETLPPEVLQKMHSPPKPWNDIPIADAHSLPLADGFLLGTPTRYTCSKT